MAQQGRAPFVSAWGFRCQQQSGRFAALRREASSPVENHAIWINWWLADVVVNALTIVLADAVGSGPTIGSNQIRVRRAG